MQRLVPACAIAFAAALLAGCPDPKAPKVPTVPKVPEPKAVEAPRFFATASPASTSKDFA